MPTQWYDKLILTPEEKTQARNDASFFHASLGTVSAPIPIIDIILNTLPNCEIKSYPLPSNLKGCTFFNGDRCQIFINTSYPPWQQRLTAGHEFRHALSSESGTSYGYDISQYLDPMAQFRERECNYFSACLLMPENLMRQKWRDFPDVDAMTSIFQVSRQAMIIELKRLGLMPRAEAERLLEPYSHFEVTFRLTAGSQTPPF